MATNRLPLLDSFFRQYPARTYRKNTILFDINQLPQGLFYIVSGRIKLASADNKNQEFIFYTLGPGEPFPLAPYFLMEPQVTTYTAMTEVEAVWRPRAEVDEFLALHPDALREMMNNVIRAFYSRVKDLSFSSSHQRVIFRLIYLAERFGRAGEKGMEISLTQQELADSLNLTRESISLILGRLQEQGLVGLSRNKIVIQLDRAMAIAQPAP